MNVHASDVTYIQVFHKFATSDAKQCAFLCRRRQCRMWGLFKTSKTAKHWSCATYLMDLPESMLKQLKASWDGNALAYWERGPVPDRFQTGFRPVSHVVGFAESMLSLTVSHRHRVHVSCQICGVMSDLRSAGLPPCHRNSGKQSESGLMLVGKRSVDVCAFPP